MNFTLSFEEADNYLVARAEGEWTSSTLRQAIRDTANMANERGFTRVLADTRDLAAPKTEFSRFLAGEDASKYFGPFIKVAVVYPMETVAVNRSANVAVFSDIDEALSWLIQGIK